MMNFTSYICGFTVKMKPAVRFVAFAKLLNGSLRCLFSPASEEHAGSHEMPSFEGSSMIFFLINEFFFFFTFCCMSPCLNPMVHAAFLAADLICVCYKHTCSVFSHQ